MYYNYIFSILELELELEAARDWQMLMDEVATDIAITNQRSDLCAPTHSAE